MFFIGGTKARPQTKESGTFFCPKEGGDRPYAKVVMKRTATVFFVPVANIGDLGEYVECRSCGATYDVAVLDLPRESDMQDALTRGMQLLAVSMIVVDGEVTIEECAAVLDLLNHHLGVDYSLEELQADLAEGQLDLQSVLQDAGSLMNIEGREAMLRAAIYLATVDGAVDQTELELIAAAGQTLGLSKAHVRGVVAESFD